MNESIEVLAANIAKDIVVSAMPNCPTDFQISIDGGELVANFYTAIFNGVYETISNTFINEEE